ncbi:protein kinase [Kovacikia minuta CCNUW1]|uniref:protein kinase domain-containing protein n=1 Tax=Kovacikia minuta TaxID=2931930 RepID=UPI001CC9E7E8|nr:protein kinase [Kovacikia minuta]UBF24731.1 protein kinase [Kovacikia minuta CCNUW1]
MTNLLSRDGMNCLELEELLDGRYRVLQMLSTGVWGQTYLAQDTRRPSQPQCIIQHVNPINIESEYQDAIRHLFVREAALLEKLADHDQIPHLLAYFEDQQGFYLVQEFVSGYPLSVELHPEKPWREDQVAHLLLECLEPLAFAHSQGIRHGNLKPDNLLRRMQDGKLMLVNFDSIKQIHLALMSLHEQPVQGVETTSQAYQPLEQIQGMPYPASDVYAIGMIAIQALTGIHPMLFPVDSESGEILWQSYCHNTESDLHQGLMELLTRMVRHDYNKRYGSAIEALDDLHRLLQATHTVAEGFDWSHPEPYPLSPVESGAALYAAQVEPQVYPQLKQSVANVETAGTSLLVGVGVGAVLSATVCGYVVLVNPPDQSDQGPQVLQNATKQYQSGQLPQAISLAESISVNSKAYKPARAAIARWQKNWQQGATQFQAMEAAFAQGQWLEVLRLAEKLPKVDYWKQQSESLVQQATEKANSETEKTLHTAYDRAIVRDFGAALTTLKQIPEAAPLHTKASEKIQEYTEKQQIQAVVNLQRAYDRAIVKDFSGAIAHLQKIPEGTTVYTKAQQKIQEYIRKQKIQAENWLATAYSQAIARNFQGALTSLEKAPSGTSLDSKIQEKTAEYTDKLNAWANFWLKKANQQANKKNFRAALVTLSKIPLGTDAYSQAREKIAEYKVKQRQQIGKKSKPTPPLAAADRDRADPAYPLIDRQSISLPNGSIPGLDSYTRDFGVDLR